MYHHNLRIAIFSQDSLLEDVVRRIEPLEHFSHEIYVRDFFDEEQLAYADIIIYDLPLAMTFKEMRFITRPWATIIACVTAEEEAAFTQEEIDSIKDIWLTPLREPRIKMRMCNILSEIKNEDDSSQRALWLDTLINSMPDLVWFKDIAGVHYKVNSRFCEFVKKDREQVEGAMHAAIWGSEDDDVSCQASEEAAITSGKTVLTDEVVKVGGEPHLFKTYKSPLLGINGEVLGTVGFGHDMTNLLNLDMELNFFIEAMPFPLVLCGENEIITKVNTHFLNFFNEKVGHLTGLSFTEWYSRALKVETSPVNNERYFRFDAPDQTSYVRLTRKDLLDIFGKKYGSINIFRDITAEKELELRIWKEANFDALTGLANRHGLEMYFQSQPEDSLMHLFYIDLDAFKAVNDTWGHKAGDEALRIVARAINHVFDEDFSARLGGDEFLVCSTRDIPLSELENLADTLLKKIRSSFSDSRELSKMSASIGILGFGRANGKNEHLIRKADRAMYAAKGMGKDRYCVWNEHLDLCAGT